MMPLCSLHAIQSIRLLVRDRRAVIKRSVTTDRAPHGSLHAHIARKGVHETFWPLGPKRIEGERIDGSRQREVQALDSAVAEYV
jgi:hypothetical protein